ncbi:stalk domain-containing protein [Paenibacillus methanolicus]|uniref:Putative pyrroloquinoline-quinone binding quinoprotein n=1 Tax=Paenibacillus methanolicus TaxID=582686 RepID=A0A5S5CGN9_9BACL|nr:stalk domain-containing protein [Paenibacillus methanolicus]TYP78279.1 putative pyrroloquinoline-quinone binding quinoprotein [Paenibacillus methanolicus]
MRKFVILLIFVWLTAAVLPAWASAEPTAGRSETFEFGDQTFTLRGTDRVELKAAIPLDSWQSPDVRVGPDGKIYAVDGNRLTAFTPAGTEVWSYPFKGSRDRYLAFSPDGNIAVYEGAGYPKTVQIPGSDPAEEYVYLPARILVFTTKGEKQSEATLDAARYVPTGQAGQFAIDRNGNLYVDSSLGFASFDSGGKLRWTNDKVAKLDPHRWGGEGLSLFSDIGAVHVTKDNTIISVNDWTRTMYGLSIDGRLLWERKLAGGMPGMNFLLTPDNRFIVEPFNSTFNVYDTRTGKVETDQTTADPAVRSVLQGDGRGSVYMRTLNGVSSEAPNGDVNWSYRARSGRVIQQPVSDSYGNMYYLDEDGSVTGLDRHGKLRFTLTGLDGMAAAAPLYVNPAGELLIFDRRGIIQLSPTSAELARLQQDASQQDPPKAPAASGGTGGQSSAGSSCTAASAASQPAGIRILIDCREVRLEKPAIQQHGSLLVPMRSIFGSLGVPVDWDAKSRRITAVKDGSTIILQVGSTTAQIGGRSVHLTVPPQSIQGTTYVPLRFISESLGYKVKWDPAVRTASIDTP